MITIENIKQALSDNLIDFIEISDTYLSVKSKLLTIRISTLMPERPFIHTMDNWEAFDNIDELISTIKNIFQIRQRANYDIGLLRARLKGLKVKFKLKGCCYLKCRVRFHRYQILLWSYYLDSNPDNITIFHKDQITDIKIDREVDYRQALFEVILGLVKNDYQIKRHCLCQEYLPNITIDDLSSTIIKIVNQQTDLLIS